MYIYVYIDGIAAATAVGASNWRWCFPPLLKLPPNALGNGGREKDGKGVKRGSNNQRLYGGRKYIRGWYSHPPNDSLFSSLVFSSPSRNSSSSSSSSITTLTSFCLIVDPSWERPLHTPRPTPVVCSPSSSEHNLNYSFYSFVLSTNSFSLQFRWRCYCHCAASVTILLSLLLPLPQSGYISHSCNFTVEDLYDIKVRCVYLGRRPVVYIAVACLVYLYISLHVFRQSMMMSLLLLFLI